MYPASFEHHAPASVDEALALLERYGDEGKVPSGRRSLVPLMTLRFASPIALDDRFQVPFTTSLEPTELVTSPVPAPAGAVDPVCGMTMSVEGAAATIEHEGGVVVFCSTHCRKAFEAESERYGGLRAR